MQTAYHASDYLYPSNPKPVDYDEINATVKRIETSNSKSKKVFKVMPRVLLIEDTPVIQYTTLVFLKLLGCKVELARNGKEAIAMFKNNYDLILTDIGLPDIDGTEVVRTIRQQEHNKHTPIIALTAFDDFVKKQCFDAGVDDFYVKPLMPEQLSVVLKNWLPKFI